ncbi:hypothetical protein [Flagellimonas crocea]|uniref:hypothetical protein n=1 Tax=Flagellimonas crocea TaxID=3067311 RepID=UPI00296F2739|nr:hypothetical protein [Muricauda sp. DH64]
MIIEPSKRPHLSGKLQGQYTKFERLIFEIRRKKITDGVTLIINKEIEKLNSLSETDKTLRTEIRKTQAKIIGLLAKKLKIVPKNYYRKTWLVLGMTAFGLPIGAAFGFSIGNMAFLGIGLPIGMSMGIALGARMDNRAKEEGRQLDIEI